MQASIIAACDSVVQAIDRAAGRDERWHQRVDNASDSVDRPIWEHPRICVVITSFVNRIRRYRSARNAAWLDDLATAIAAGTDPLAIAHDFIGRKRMPLVGFHFFVAFPCPCCGGTKTITMAPSIYADLRDIACDVCDGRGSV